MPDHHRREQPTMQRNVITSQSGPQGGLSLADLGRVYTGWQGGPGSRVPFNAKSPANELRHASSTGPKTWVDLETAQSFAEERLAGETDYGVGIMLAPVPKRPGWRTVGFDLDGCRNAETGEVAHWGQAIIDRCGSYTGPSPSGTGIRIIGTMRDADFEALRDAGLLGSGEGKAGCSYAFGDHVEIAFFGERKFLTLTPEVIGDGRVRPLSLDNLEWLLGEHGPACKALYGAPKVERKGGSKGRDDTGSGEGWRFCLGLFRMGHDEEEVREAIAADKGPAGQWWGRSDERQRDRTVTRTKAKVEAEREAQATDFDDEGVEMGAAMATVDEFGDEEEIVALVGQRVKSETALALIWLSPDDCANFKPPPYVLKGLIARGNMVTVVGSPGVGKTPLASYVAYRIALGLSVFGRRTKQGPVLYLAAENPGDMQKRIAALKERHGPCENFHMQADCGGRFRDPKFLTRLKGDILKLKPVLIVVDTLRAALPGMKENDSEGMGEAIITMRSLAKLGPAVLLVDHDNVAGSGLPRGHGSLHADVDMNLALRRNDAGDVIGTPSKNRNGESNVPVLAYTIAPVTLEMLDEDGESETSVVCEPKDLGEAKGEAKGGKLPRGASAAYAVLKGLSQGRKAVAESEWRDACVNGRNVSTSEDEDSRARAFRRAATTLLERKTVAFADGQYSLVGIRQPDPSEFADDFADPEEE